MSRTSSIRDFVRCTLRDGNTDGDEGWIGYLLAKFCLPMHRGCCCCSMKSVNFVFSGSAVGGCEVIVLGILQPCLEK